MNLKNCYYRNTSDLMESSNERTLIDFEKGKVYYDFYTSKVKGFSKYFCGAYEDSTWAQGWYTEKSMDLNTLERFKKLNPYLFEEWLKDDYEELKKEDAEKKNFGKKTYQNAVEILGKKKTKNILKVSNIAILNYVLTLEKEIGHIKDVMLPAIKYAVKYNSWKHFFNVLGEDFPSERRFSFTLEGIYLFYAKINKSTHENIWDNDGLIKKIREL